MDWLKLIHGKNSFHCETEEIADEFLKIMNDLGFKWRSETSLIDDNLWNTFKEKTCYDYSSDENLIGFGFGGVETIRDMGFNIINVKELLYGRKPFKLFRE